MRLQDLVIGGHGNYGIYKYIKTRDDYLKFLELCKKHQPKSHEFGIGDSKWCASEDNFGKYLQLGTACAYISGITGVIGISSSPQVLSRNYEELTEKSHIALKYIKSLKE